MHFTTRSLKQTSRSTAMKDAIKNLCGPLTTDFSQAPKSLQGTIDTRKVGTFNCSRVEQPASSISRNWDEIKQGVPLYYIIVLQISGTCECEQDGKEVSLSPGKITIINSTVPFHLTFSPKTVQFILHIPKSEMDNGAVFWEDQLVTCCQTSAATLIKALIISAFGQDDPDDSLHARTLSKTIIQLLSESYQNTHAKSDQPNKQKSDQLKLAQEYLLNYLTDPKLSPKMVAHAIGLSERHLHRIFQTSGLSISRWIKQSRLDRCALALSDQKQNQRRISEIAHYWGFSDSAHFSRAFLVEFGQTPREYRFSSQANE